MKALSPAKLNLFLHINAQRDDGYHEIQTLFQLLNFGDDLEFTLTDSAIELQQQSVKEIQLDNTFKSENNLILRAANTLKQHCSIDKGVSINLYKRIPLGAGLGGGSSNAATTLLALNQLWDCQLSIAELSEIGRRLGADVPIFIEQKTALAEGVGELLTPITTPKQWFIVVNPEIFVSTTLIFNHCELTRGTSRITIRDLEQQLPNIVNNIDDVSFKNDCQKLAEQCYPQLRFCKEQLNGLLQELQIDKRFQMTGTGSSYFVGIADYEVAEQLIRPISELAKKKNWYCFMAQSINSRDINSTTT